MSYLGSKAASGAYQKIIALFPPHDVYIETHLGGGAVMRHKPPAAVNIGIERDYEVLQRFRCDYEISKVHGRCEEFLANCDYVRSSRTLIYADPPYLLSTRTSRHRYKFDYIENDHVYLLRQLKRLCCSVVISGYPSQLYDELLQGWNTLEFQVMTRGGVRTEKVWFNYEPGQIAWSDYAGSDFTDRQRIKRKAQRWAAKYEGLPSHERLAVMAAMAAVDVKAAMSAVDRE